VEYGVEFCLIVWSGVLSWNLECSFGVESGVEFWRGIWSGVLLWSLEWSFAWSVN
jgi:hypothetical protein